MLFRPLRSLLLPLYLALGTTVAPAQSTSGVTLSGRIVDAESKGALPYLSVQLLTEKDSAFVSGRLTDESGGFSFSGLKKGSYVLAARRIG